MTDKKLRAPEGDVIVYDERDEICHYLMACVRAWGIADRYVCLTATDPRVMMWYGVPETLFAEGPIALIAGNGRRYSGVEAVERILYGLPSGRGRMLAVLLGERPTLMGEPATALWQPGKNPKRDRPPESPIAPRFNTRGQLTQVNRMGN
jgi:hypothetical protein